MLVVVEVVVVEMVMVELLAVEVLVVKGENVVLVMNSRKPIEIELSEGKFKKLLFMFMVISITTWKKKTA